MSTTIGEVNINLRMNLAQFKNDVQQGTQDASRATKQLAEDTKGNTQEARGALMLLGEEIGVHIPRHLTTLLASLPGVGNALQAIFTSVAAIAFIEVLAKVVEKIQGTQEAIDKANDAVKTLNQGFDDQIEKLTTSHGAWVDLGNAISKVSADWYTAQKAQADASNTLFGKFLNVSGIGYAFEFWKGKLNEVTEATHSAADANKAFLDDIANIAKTQGPKAALDELNSRLAFLGQGLSGAEPGIQLVAAQLKNQLGKDAKDAADKLAKLNEELAKVIAGVSKLRDVRGVSGPTLPTNVDPSGIFGLGQTLEKLPNPQAPIYSGTKEAEDLYKAQTDQNAAVSDAQRIYTQTRTAQEQYAEEMQLLNVLLTEGNIDQDTYNRAVKQAKAALDTTSPAWHKFGQEIGTTVEQALLFGRSWSDALKTILGDLIKVIIQMTLLKSLSAATSGTGGFFGSLLGGLFGGGRASGGLVDSSHAYLVGENGPEVFSPGTTGQITPNASGRASVTNVYNVDARGSTLSKEDITRAIQQSENRAVQRSVLTVSELQKRT